MDELETAYPVMSDLELEGATRVRNESEARFSDTPGRFGVTQFYTPDQGVSLEELEAQALAVAADQDLATEYVETFNWWIACEPTGETGVDDIVRIGISEQDDWLVVEVYKGRCQ